jgi:hypothetical protein
MAEAAGDVLGANGLRSACAIMAAADGRDEEARAHAQRALAEARQLRQPTLEISALYANGMAHVRADPLQAIRYLNDTLDLVRRMDIDGDERSALALLADLEAQLGNQRRALEALREMVAGAIRVPYAGGFDVFFYNGSRAFNRAGRPDLVALCDGQFRRRRRRGELTPSPLFAEFHDHDVHEARTALGDAEFERHAAAGAALTPDGFTQQILHEIEILLADK